MRKSRSANFGAACIVAIALNASPGSSQELRLPFPDGTSYPCTQGPSEPFSHGTRSTSHDLDFDTPNDSDQPVVAAADGRAYVHRDSNPRSFGNHVNVDHGGGVFTLYAHLDSISVSYRQEVKRGEVLGTEGSTGFATGDHIHFGLHRGDPRLNALSSQSIPIEQLVLRNVTRGTGPAIVRGSDLNCALSDSDIGDTYASNNNAPDTPASYAVADDMRSNSVAEESEPPRPISADASLVGTWRPKVSSTSGFTMTFDDAGIVTAGSRNLTKVEYQRNGSQIIFDPTGQSERFEIVELTPTTLKLRGRTQRLAEWVRVTVADLVEAASAPSEHEQKLAAQMEGLLEKLFVADPNSFSSKSLGKLLIDNYGKASAGTKSLLSPQLHVFAAEGKKSDLTTTLRKALNEKIRSGSNR